MLFVSIALFGLLHPPTFFVSAQEPYFCNTPNNEPGQCLPIRSCPPLLNLLQQQGIAAGEYLRQSLCFNQNGNPIVCCPASPPRDGKNTENVYGPLTPPDCGYSNITHTKVIGGVPAQLGAWPWIAALGFRNPKNPEKPLWRCGGSLISARHVLTAAHCAVRSEVYMVRIGDLILDRDDDGAHPIDVEIEQKIIHPGYSTSRFVNDIAVLRLAADVPFSDYVKPICLPVEEPYRSSDYHRKYPFVAGWGAIATRGPATVNLMEVQLPVVTNENCRRAYADFPNAQIDERVLCAGFPQGGKDACQGDSGGPLILPKTQEIYYQIGVVSYGYKCAESGYPGVYTRVAEFLDFIISALQ